MTWFPDCAGSEEGPTNFEPPTIGVPFLRGVRRRLREGNLKEPPEPIAPMKNKPPKTVGGNFPMGQGPLPQQQRSPMGMPLQTAAPMPAPSGSSSSSSQSPPVAGVRGSTSGDSGRKNPVPGIPKKSDQPSEDVRGEGSTRLTSQQMSRYLADRYDKSHESRRRRRR